MQLNRLLTQMDDAVFCALDAPSDILANASAKLLQDGAYVRWLMGSRMTNKSSLLDEFSAALQFPYYFGSNWDAFDECLQQMVIPDLHSIILLIYDANRVLQSQPEQLQTFIASIEDARHAYQRPAFQGMPWQHFCVPFHIILQANAKDVTKWREAGASIAWLDIP